MDCQLNYCLDQNTTVLLAAIHVIVGTIEFYAGGKNIVILQVPVCVDTALQTFTHLQHASANAVFLSVSCAVMLL